MNPETKKSIEQFTRTAKNAVSEFNEIFGDAGELLETLNRGVDRGVDLGLLNSPTEISYPRFFQYYVKNSKEVGYEIDQEVIRFLLESLVFIGWYYSRSVAIFTSELENELKETQTNVDLEPVVFERLRGFPVYIPFCGETKKSHGALVALIDKNIEGVALAFIRLNYDESFVFTHVIIRQEGVINLNQIIDELELSGWSEADAVEMGVKALYVITERSHVNPSTYQPRIIKKKGRRAKFAAPENFKMVLFGEQFTNAIREYQKQKREYESSDSTRTVRPHVRRAHWHTFLTGPRNEKRNQVVKWIPPIFVMADHD